MTSDQIGMKANKARCEETAGSNKERKGPELLSIPGKGGKVSWRVQLRFIPSDIAQEDQKEGFVQSSSNVSVCF